MRADNDHAVKNSVESCKDDSKPHKCPEVKWEDAENNSNACEVFYDTRSDDEWDKEDVENHSCRYSNETQKQLLDNSHDIVAKMNSLEKVDPVFYMDKNVTACDLPEIVVCYNEKTYHVVKDICVDDSVRSNSDSNSNQCSPNPLKTKSLKDRNCKLEDSELRNDPEANQDVEETSRDEVATSENVLKESLTLEDEQKPLNNSNKSNKREEQSLLQLQEKGTRSLGTPALKTELEETVDQEKAQEKFSSVSTKTSQGLFGETSFSAAEPVSGHITYSGQIVFSGSLSVRSDASTTSGRSFAFPVLQSEWNSSSPVRMAKANKKRQKGWRDILMCCRFS